MKRDGAERRLAEAQDQAVLWRRWGPYLSERHWGMVRAASTAQDGVERGTVARIHEGERTSQAEFVGRTPGRTP